MRGEKFWDFNRIVDNVTYFSKHKKDTKVYVKTIDIVVNTDEKRLTFQSVFQGISDYLGIEHIIPVIHGIDYAKLKEDYSHGVRGNSLVRGGRCPSPFYTISIAANGNAWGCCYYPVPQVFGNITKQSLKELWNGKTRMWFLRSILTKKPPEECRKCSAGLFLAQPEDDIDDISAENIMKRLGKTDDSLARQYFIE